jgi:hypothetical protein
MEQRSNFLRNKIQGTATGHLIQAMQPGRYHRTSASGSARMKLTRDQDNHNTRILVCSHVEERAG